jgi:long-chain acyl-CoA synthetase
MTHDRPATITETCAWAAARYPDNVAIRQVRDEVKHELTYAELAEAVRAVAAGLLALGVRAGDRIALLAETCPEWTVCDLAVASVGAVCVPIYPTNSATECAWVLGDSGATVLICQGQEHLDRIAEVRGSLPELATVVTMTDTGDADALSLNGLRELAGTADLSGVVVPDVTEPNTIVYTSGTTGPPKGCLLTHRGWRTSLDAIESVTSLGQGDVIYVYLPLAHLFSRMVVLTALECGATLHFFGGDISQVVAELATVRPTHLPSVPRMFEKVYRTVLAHAGADGQERVAAAVEVGLRVRRAREHGDPVSEVDAAAFERAETMLFSLVRAAFGGQVREALSAAAPIAKEILEFFYACGVPIYEAYGMTESTALISANTPGVVRFGTVGRALPGVEVTIAPDGEVLARGANVFAGYHGNPTATAETVVDGWLHTGDLGELDADGYLTISGRKKDIIITAGGKNLTPANLETDLRQCPLISHAVMIGDRRPYPVALLTLDAEEVATWAAERGLGDVGPTHPELMAELREVVDRANEEYAPPERVRRFAVLDRDFSQETGELTPTLKVRRSAVSELYASVIEGLYA